MDLHPYVERLRSDLTDAAAAGGEQTREVAARLMLALDPAARMVLLEALSQAAAEITGALDRDAVDVRMAGREPEFVVTHFGEAEATPPPAPPTPPEAPEAADAGADLGTARITLRLPESVKSRAEDAAADTGQSLNAWLVDSIRAVLDGATIGDRVDLRFGRSSLSVTGGGSVTTNRGRRHQGWVQ